MKPFCIWENSHITVKILVERKILFLFDLSRKWVNFEHFCHVNEANLMLLSCTSVKGLSIHTVHNKLLLQYDTILVVRLIFCLKDFGIIGLWRPTSWWLDLPRLAKPSSFSKSRIDRIPILYGYTVRVFVQTGREL